MDCTELEELCIKIKRNVEEVSGNAYFFFHYPFHDLHHCQNMYQYLEDLRNYVRLEYPELWLLRMAIYLHDIGMFINPRYWHKLGVPVDGLSPPGKDLIRELEKDAIVESLLENLRMSFEDAFFDENGCLRLPPPLKEKPWDEFSLVEKTAIRVVMRTFHPQIGDWSVRKRFIGEYPLECRKLAEMIGGMVRLHEDKTDGRIKNLGSWEIAGSSGGVDQKKLTALLILLDSLDCAGQSRASPEALDEIIDEVRMLEEKAIEIEAQKGGRTNRNHEHLPHWVFKKYIKEVRISPNQIMIITETANLSYIAGIILFEIAKNLLPKYALASDILKGNFHFQLVVQIPGSAYFIGEDLIKHGKKFCEDTVNISELPQQLREKYEKYDIDELSLPRTLALLLSYGGKCSEHADQLAKKHVCKLLAEPGGGRKNQFEKVFKCD